MSRSRSNRPATGATLSRRGFVLGGAAVGGALLLPRAATAATTPAISNPFTLGVASGEPLHNSVVLWTRLAPQPLELDAGMPAVQVPVQWEIARDEGFSKVVHRGEEQAVPEEAHSVHVEVQGLEPHYEYYYRFRVGTEISPVGRTRTAPAPGTRPEVKFAFASCANWEQGLFTAYRHMSEEDVDVYFHLGDYIYEYAAGVNGNVRRYVGDEINTLEEYRRRHAQYKTDPDLQTVHAAAPFIVTWDDHELDNNYADLIPENQDAGQSNDTLEAFTARRTAAYQAYWENMPLRRSMKPVGTALPLFRRFQYGHMATFSVLDTRQYRTDQPYGDRSQIYGPEQWNPAATILGDPQHAWLEEGLASSKAVWNVVPQQIRFANHDGVAGAGDGGYNDGWDGYRVSRDRILGFVGERGIDNFVVLTGDVHANWMNDLRRDFEQPETPVLGTEFVGTSISSGGNGNGATEPSAVVRAENPHVKYYLNRRGYVRCRLTQDQYIADYRAVDYVTTPNAPIRTDASFVIESGVAGAQRI